MRHWSESLFTKPSSTLVRLSRLFFLCSCILLPLPRVPLEPHPVVHVPFVLFFASAVWALLRRSEGLASAILSSPDSFSATLHAGDEKSMTAIIPHGCGIAFLLPSLFSLDSPRTSRKVPCPCASLFLFQSLPKASDPRRLFPFLPRRFVRDALAGFLY